MPTRPLPDDLILKGYDEGGEISHWCRSMEW